MSIIQTKELVKNYDYYEKELGFANSVKNMFHREKLIREAVKGISLEIEEGEIVGFIGPNGAGKTTTLKMLSGILYPTSGTALVNGYIPWERKKQFKMNFSIVMGQKSQLNWDLPANESLYLNQCIYEVSDIDYKKNLEELIEVLGAKELLKVQVRRLSLGERMKMELIAALIHKPKIIFLDEPTIGLDLISQKKIREFIQYYNVQNNATIILTSHYINDIETLCRRTAIINHGNLVYDGDLNKINERFSQNKIIKVQFSKTIQENELTQYGTVKQYDGISVVLEVNKHDMRNCAKKILDDLPVIDLNIEDTPIEEAISYIYQKGE